MAVCEKRSLEETVHNAKNVLLDIEGTTTSISFVKDTLFPYVRKSLESYVTANWDKDEFKEVLTLLREQATTDVDSKVDGAVAIPSEGSVDEQQAAVVSNVLWQMDLDRKTTALKQLQGLVWRLGYKDGELKGHVYPDVAPALRRWTEGGRKLYVYSSGSVEAQKLLFKYSQEGDLSELFSGHFDTTVGPKVEADSYKAIVKSLDCNPDNVIFLTDLPKEASAARKAGLPVVLVTREDAQELSADDKADFSSVSTLEDLVFEASAVKKQKMDEIAAPKKGVSEEAKAEKAVEEVEKMDVDEEKETPKTDVAEKEEPKTEVAEKKEKMEDDVEKVEDVKETAETVSEKVIETKEETEKKVKKMEDDSKPKVEDKAADKKPDEKIVEKKTEKTEEKKSTEEAKSVKESAKPSEESSKAEKVESKSVVEETKALPVEEKKVEKSESVSSEKKAETEEKEAEKVSAAEEKGKPTEKVEEKVKDDKTEKVTEEKQAGEVVEKLVEAKIEKKAEEKVDENPVEKVEAVEDKTVENKQEDKEIEKAVEAKKETDESKKEESVSEANVESKVTKQNGLENGQSVNGVSNGKTEETSNGKAEENCKAEVVVKKAAVAAGADAEMATEA